MTMPWLITLDEVASTNTWCLERWQALAHGAVVWTPRQTAGRGRGGHGWVAPPGVLTASFAVHTEAAAGPLALASGLAVLHTADDLTPGLRGGIKWPNDVLIGRRKVAGVLVERPAPGVAIIGVGLNLAVSWAGADADLRTSLRDQGADLDETPKSHHRVLALLRRYLLEAAGMIRIGGFPALLPTLRERDVLRGHPVTVRDGDREITGISRGVDEEGRLQVGHHRVTAGHVAHWGPTEP